MQIKLDKHNSKKGVRTQVRIVEAFRPGPGAMPKQRTVESLGCLEDRENPETFLQLLRERVAEMNRGNAVTLNLDLARKNKDKTNLTKNYGCLFIEKVYELLRLPQFFEKNRKSKACYDLNEIFFFLITMRILDPDSKRATFMGCQTLYGKTYDFTLVDVYRALDEIAELKDKLEQHLNSRIGELLKCDSSYLYLDATNYYFETDFAMEGHLPQKGVSKEHRLDPIVQMGLILDSNGLPILSEVFPGNTADCKMLVPMIEKAVSARLSERYTVIADKGLNSSENIDYLVNRGHGYVFSQTLRGTKGKRYEESLFREADYIVHPGGEFKSKSFQEEYFGKDMLGKRVKRTRRVLLGWSRKEAELAHKKREAKVRRSRKALKNAAYLIDHTKMEYLKEVVRSDTGEVLDEAKKSYILDLEKIEAESRYDGYFCLITSEEGWSEREITQTYSRLWKIEQSFRITKSDLSSRPVYVRLDTRIRAHFFVCHVSLLILRLFEIALCPQRISAERLQNVLRHCTLDQSTMGFLHLHEVGGKTDFMTRLTPDGRLRYTLTPDASDEIFSDFVRLLSIFNLDLDLSFIHREKFDQKFRAANLALQK